MHAASVHPEPGSNSRNHCIKTSGLPDDPICFRVLLLASFTFVWVVFSSVRISEIRFKLFCFVLLSCCSIFKDHFRHRFCGSSNIIPLSNAFVKPFLKSFFNFFQVFSFAFAVTVLLADSLNIIPLLFPFVNTFFQFFINLELFTTFIWQNPRHYKKMHKQAAKLVRKSEKKM